MSKSGSGEGNVVPFAPKERTEAAGERRKRRRPTLGSKLILRNEWPNASSDCKYNRSFKLGEIVKCEVVCAEPGGYHVVIPEFSHLDGFLPFNATLKPGTRIAATYVCIHEGRLLLTARFTAKALKMDWDDHMAFTDNYPENSDDES